MLSLSNFSSIFPGGSADPICPYVRTPMLHNNNNNTLTTLPAAVNLSTVVRVTIITRFHHYAQFKTRTTNGR